jgi:uncharacterized protein YceH (UPF0502 family)
MNTLELRAPEARILGCLIEKQRTTPDAYPLSLNALRLACNQSTNRDPVVDYDDTTIREGLHRLERRGLVRLASGAGSRASKYRHLLADALPMDGAEQAVICVLLLRGAQTPGELKQRTERMHAFGSLADVHATLEALLARELAARHERRPGQKEDRYSHLLGATDDASVGAATGEGAAGAMAPIGHTTSHAGAQAADRGEGGGLAAELDALAERVARLERELAELRGAAEPNGAVGRVDASPAPAGVAHGAPGPPLD